MYPRVVQTNIHGMNGMWSLRPWVLSSTSVWHHSNRVNGLLVNAHSIPKHRYTSTALNGRLFDSPCRPGIHLPRKVKVEPDLSLVRDKFSVRYECLQSLELDVNYKVFSGFTTVHGLSGFYIFIRFQACFVACHPKALISFELQW